MSSARKVVLGILALLVVAAGAGYVGWLRPLRALADLGAGYVAKQMCSCVYVAARSFESCGPDMLPSMERIQAEPLSEGKGVRAYVPLFADRRAVYREGLGCTLQ